MILSQRLKQVREAWGMSQRKLSLELGLSPGTWAFYESGASQPGTPTIDALGNKGVDLNWLICGFGSMWRREEAPSSTREGYLEQSDRQVSSSLKLGRMSIQAHTSHMKNKLRILELLARSGAKRFSELLAVAELDADSAVGILNELIAEGKVNVNVANGHESYCVGGSILERIQTSSDCDYLTFAAVQTIVTQIGPQVSRETKEALLVNANVYIEHGKTTETLQRVLTALHEICSEPQSADCDVLSLVLAVGKLEK